MKTLRFFLFLILFIVSIDVFAKKVIVLGDVEGNWNRVKRFLGEREEIGYQDKTPYLAEGYDFVFLGDSVDKSWGSLRFLNFLIKIKEKYPERVHLIIGNRDINKLPLVGLKHLEGHLLVSSVKNFLNARNARKSFEFRKKELEIFGKLPTDEEVAKSLIADLKKGGALYRYYELAQVMAFIDNTLYLHAYLPPYNYKVGFNAEKYASIEAWVQGLNEWKALRLKDWQNSRAFEDELVVKLHLFASGRFTNASGNPILPSDFLIQMLAKDGCQRIVAGHTPIGESPGFVRHPAFELVLADTSVAYDSALPFIVIDGKKTILEQKLKSGMQLRHEFSIGDKSPIGTFTDDGFLFKGYEATKGVFYRVQNSGSQFQFETVVREVNIQRSDKDCRTELVSESRGSAG